jgi:hypothetical protein
MRVMENAMKNALSKTPAASPAHHTVWSVLPPLIRRAAGKAQGFECGEGGGVVHRPLRFDRAAVD